MEAENYLSSGYGLRLAIQARAAGWHPLSHLAEAWQPSRLKGIQVSPDVGTPFLAATQVFDTRPFPRKWLALAKTHDSGNRFVSDGTILVTCSGAVGRATLAHAPHRDTLISHDLLRIRVKNPAYWGWIYAFLRSPQARAMMTSAKYGHMIKHLETSHLDALPAPSVNATVAERFKKKAERILELRNQGYEKTLQAESLFEKALGKFTPSDKGESGFIVKSEGLFSKRRRLEASVHAPNVAALRKHLIANGNGFSMLKNAGFDIWVPGRYKRIPAEDGVEYFDSADLLEISPDISKKFADCDFGDSHSGRVKNGWLLVPCSGQVYGIIGSIAFAGQNLEGQVVSNHVMRIAPTANSKIRIGYLLTALSHPSLGRPLIKSLPFGSSVPEIDPAEFAMLDIVRLKPETENQIAELSETGGTLRTTADVLEKELGLEAGVIIDKFIEGDLSDFIV